MGKCWIPGSCRFQLSSDPATLGTSQSVLIRGGGLISGVQRRGEFTVSDILVQIAVCPR